MLGLKSSAWKAGPEGSETVCSCKALQCHMHASRGTRLTCVCKDPFRTGLAEIAFASNIESQTSRLVPANRDASQPDSNSMPENAHASTGMTLDARKPALPVALLASTFVATLAVDDMTSCSKFDNLAVMRSSASFSTRRSSLARCASKALTAGSGTCTSTTGYSSGKASPREEHYCARHRRKVKANWLTNNS